MLQLSETRTQKRGIIEKKNENIYVCKNFKKRLITTEGYVEISYLILEQQHPLCRKKSHENTFLKL
jgi:hypothetical protein